MPQLFGQTYLHLELQIMAWSCCEASRAAPHPFLDVSLSAYISKCHIPIPRHCDIITVPTAKAGRRARFAASRQSPLSLALDRSTVNYKPSEQRVLKFIRSAENRHSIPINHLFVRTSFLHTTESFLALSLILSIPLTANRRHCPLS